MNVFRGDYTRKRNKPGVGRWPPVDFPSRTVGFATVIREGG